MRNDTLTIIIPVSTHESISTIQRSINSFMNIDFSGFDERIVYAIDAPRDIYIYHDELKIANNMEILWVLYPDTELKQAGAYNAGLREYPNSDYYAFFDIDAFPKSDFFQKCAQVDANFVTGNRHVSNVYKNNITRVVAEEYEFCNAGRRFMYKYVGKYFPASCTGLISGITLRYFSFKEATSADSELYRHILQYGFSMGYAHDTNYAEGAPDTKKKLYNQRLRWLSDTWRTLVATVSSGNSWKVNIANFLMYSVGMFPITGCILLIPYGSKMNGCIFVFHSLYMQYISLVALAKVINGDDVEWV